jgi:L-fuconolactonase
MPWLDGDAVLERSFGLADFRAATDGLALDALVYVQVDVAPAYALLEAEWAVQQPVAGVVAFAPLEDGSIAGSYLDRLVPLGPRIKGVRRLIQSEPDPDFPLRLVEGLRLLPRYGLSFDICLKHHQLARAVEMVRACPETSFILDHLGKPDVQAGLLEPWRSHISDLAALPNVACKLSGLVTEADHERWTPADLLPYVAHVLAAFGPDRILFGSDWPVMTLATTYPQWLETVQALAPNQPNLWSANARRIYRLS